MTAKMDCNNNNRVVVDDYWTIDSLVLLDVPDAALLVAEPLGGAVPAELLDELARPASDVSREVDGVDALRDVEQFEFDELHALWFMRDWLCGTISNVIFRMSICLLLLK